jgi:hypothetical protein
MCSVELRFWEIFLQLDGINVMIMTTVALIALTTTTVTPCSPTGVDKKTCAFYGIGNFITTLTKAPK